MIISIVWFVIGSIILEMAHKGLTEEEFGAVVGYSVTGCRLEIVGVCPECQRKKDNREEEQ